MPRIRDHYVESISRLKLTLKNNFHLIRGAFLVQGKFRKATAHASTSNLPLVSLYSYSRPRFSDADKNWPR